MALMVASTWAVAAANPITAASLSDGSTIAILGGLRPWGESVNSTLIYTDDYVASEGLANVALVAKSMTVVCLESVEHVEDDIHSAQDALRIGGVMASVCERVALEHWNNTHFKTLDTSTTNTLHRWCGQLDGDLVAAFEMGISALHARQQTGSKTSASPSQNSYAHMTRRSFCEQFQEAIDAEVGREHAVVAPPMVHVTTNVLSKVALPDNGVVVAQPSRLLVSSGRSLAATKQAFGVDMLSIAQATLRVEHGDAWNRVCSELVSSLSASEAEVVVHLRGSAASHPILQSVDRFLAFNALDQRRISRCASQMKSLAIQEGMLERPPGSASSPSMLTLGAALDVSDRVADSDVLELLVDSPWAREICDDMARGFLAERSVDAGATSTLSYCAEYAADLQRIEAHVDPVDELREDLARLRKSPRSDQRLAQILDTTALPRRIVALTSKRSDLASQVALAPTGSPKNFTEADDADDDESGAAFWSR